MVTERLIPDAVNSGYRNSERRELVEKQTRPIFVVENSRRVYNHVLFSYYPDYRYIIDIKSGKKIGLTPRENSIFKGLVENVNQVMSHTTLGVSDNLLRQYIGRLKRKTQSLSEDSEIIHSIGENVTSWKIKAD